MDSLTLRVATRAMTPEKMVGLLQKLRKGAATSIKQSELDQVLAHLKGYRTEEFVWLEPEADFNGVRTYVNSNPRNVEATWEYAKNHEVSTLPTNPKLNESYYMNVSGLTSLNGQTAFTYKMWHGSEAIRVTAPNNKTFEHHGSLRAFLESYPVNTGMLKWLRTETPFLAQINEKLGTEDYDTERTRKTLPKSRDNTGICPVCWGKFKLTPKAKQGSDRSLPGMTLHGYKRPGTGFIHGNCFGHNWPPFELSAEGTIAWVAMLETYLKREESYLVRLKGGQITILVDFRGQEIPVNSPDWDRQHKLAISKSEDVVTDLNRTLRQCKSAIIAWTPVSAY